jgi:alpha-tubulin suppressor-like RCC1 family protein
LNPTQTKGYKTDFTEDEIVDMQGGENHVLVLTNTGKVFSYGQNSTY